MHTRLQDKARILGFNLSLPSTNGGTNRERAENVQTMQRLFTRQAEVQLVFLQFLEHCTTLCTAK